MKVALASDHGGFEQKGIVLAALRDAGFDVEDFGPATGDRCDYPDYAARVCEAIQAGVIDRGILICGTGIGMSIAANKFDGIYAAVVPNVDYALLSREHNNANVLCLSGRFVDPETNIECAKLFLTTDFEGGRHAERVGKVAAIEEREAGRALAPCVPVADVVDATGVAGEEA